jgi:Tn3 transposase DDE domain
LLTGIADEDLIASEWDNMLRLAASFNYGHSTASLLVGKLSAGPRQNLPVLVRRKLSPQDRTPAQQGRIHARPAP